jgi:hypothetical protein
MNSVDWIFNGIKDIRRYLRYRHRQLSLANPLYDRNVPVVDSNLSLARQGVAASDGFVVAGERQRV